MKSIERITGSESEGDVLSEFTELAVEETNEVGNGLLIGVTGSTSLLIVIGGLVTFGTSIGSLCGLVGGSLVCIILGSLGGGDSVVEGSNLGLEVSDGGVVLVDVLVEEGDVLVESDGAGIFSLSLEVERLVQHVLEVIDELNDSSGELLVGFLVGSGGEGSKHLDGLSV